MTDLCKEINAFGKGISNEARYRILEALLKGKKSVGDLVDIVRLSQPAVSQHLKTLKLYNLVVDEKKGQEVLYSINSEYTLKLLASLVNDMKKCKDE